MDGLETKPNMPVIFYSGELCSKRMIKNEVDATAGLLLLSYKVAKFFVPFAAKRTSPGLSKCF